MKHPNVGLAGGLGVASAVVALYLLSPSPSMEMAAALLIGMVVPTLLLYLAIRRSNRKTNDDAAP